MNKLSILIILFLSNLSIHATHIIGGSITYEHVEDSTYKIKLEILRDCFGHVPFDDFANLAVFDEFGNYVTSIQNQGVIAIPLDPSSLEWILDSNNICDYSDIVCVQRAIYNQVITFPDDSQKYTLSYQRCCRASTLTNIIDPLNAGMTLTTVINTAVINDSPQFIKEVPSAVFANTPFIYNAAAMDADGDSLVYELVTPYHGATFDNPLPSFPTPPPYDNIIFSNGFSLSNILGGNYPLAINSKTGEMTAIPLLLGVYQIAYKISEYRNDVLIGQTIRDFPFIVGPQPNGISYNVSGKVKIDNTNSLDIGKVQLFERDITTDLLTLNDEYEINTEGDFNFMNIPQGVFYFKAIIDPSSKYFDTHLNTYYKNNVYWYDANELDQCDTSQTKRDIFLKPAKIINGPITLDGIVTNSSDNTIIPYANLLLVDESGTIIQTRESNELGYFNFDNLEEGVHFLHGDFINSNIDNTNAPMIDLKKNTSIEVMIFDDLIEVDILSSTDNISVQNKLDVIIYPNPSDNIVNFNVLTRNIDQPFELIILDTHAKVIKSIKGHKMLNRNTVSIFNLNKGLYFCKVINGEASSIQKFIIQ